MFTKTEQGWSKYIRDEKDTKVGILFGHFSPFTGPKGHGRMVDALIKLGCKKFVVGIPDTGEKLDTERNLFNASQRKEQVEDYFNSIGLECEVLLTRTGKAPEKILWYLSYFASTKYGPNIRTIYCFGDDRKDSFSKYFTDYESDNLEQYEAIYLTDRGAEETSGTAVREAIKAQDIAKIIQLTGYTETQVQKILDTYQKNCRLLARQASSDKAMEGKHHLLHLFNGNKSSQMDPKTFFALLDEIQVNGDKLDNNNFDISEKIDGSSSFAGSDEFGFYFAKFGVSVKMRKEADVDPRYKVFFTELKKSGLPEILEDFRLKEEVLDFKVQLENVIPGASKNPEFAQSVLVSYDLDKIGKGLVIPIQVIADGIDSKFTKEAISDVQLCLKAAGFNCLKSSEIKIDLQGGIDCSDIINQALPYMSKKVFKKEDKEVISQLQSDLQDRILEKVPNGAFGKNFEGIVFTSKTTPGFQFKVTSKEFKDMMAIHNAGRWGKKKTLTTENVKALKRRLSEGGNLTVTGSEGEQQATKLRPEEMGPEMFKEFQDLFVDFLFEFEKAFKAETGKGFWNDKNLVTSGKIFSGSTRSFFTKDWATFSKFKKTVGDMDVQVPEFVNENGEFHQFLIDNQGKQFGAFTLYGSKDKDSNNQGHSLITPLDQKYWEVGGKYIQIDWEYTPWTEEDLPDDWNDIAHYSSWTDIENGIKGAMVKILIRATIDTISERPDLLEPTANWVSAKTGKAVKNPNLGKDGEIKSIPRTRKFSVDGGLQTLINQNDDGSVSKPEIKDRKRSYKIADVFELLFNRPMQGEADKTKLLSFIRYCNALEESDVFTPELLNRIFRRYLRYFWAEYAQKLSTNIQEDKEWKYTTINKMFELIPELNTPENQAKVQEISSTFYTAWENGEGGGTMIESRRRKSNKLKESITPDGKELLVYSFSKDTDLFHYYFDDILDFGKNASSAYGLAAYAILDPDQIIGYSDEQHSKLYGDNCFEFTIPTNKVFFINWSDFEQTQLCKDLGSTKDTYISDQLDYFDVDEKVKSKVEQLIPGSDESTGQQANNFWRLMSRYYYQDARGSLRTPMAGFVYTGKNDGHTFVGWYAKAMVPNRVKVAQEDWKEIDKNSPEYKEYLASAQGYRFDKNNSKDKMRIFDGNPTPEKEGVYRLFMKASAADDEGLTSFADGVYKNIVIHDDKTVDFTFRSNLIDQNRGVHYIGLRSPLLKALNKVGYKFGKVDASLSLGSESTPIDEQKQLEDFSPELWPDQISGGLKLAGQYLNSDSMSSIKTEFEDKTLFLAKCQIEEDVFDGWEVKLKDGAGKECWTPDEATWDKLASKYDWMGSVLKTPPEIKRTTKQDETYFQAKIDKAQSDLDAANEALTAAQESGNEKKVAAAQKKVDKAQADIDKYSQKKLDAIQKAANAQATLERGQASWDNHIERIKTGWKNESIDNLLKTFEEEAPMARYSKDINFLV